MTGFNIPIVIKPNFSTLMDVKDIEWFTVRTQKWTADSSYFFLNICRGGMRVFYPYPRGVCIIHRLLFNFLQPTSLCVINERFLLYYMMRF